MTYWSNGICDLHQCDARNIPLPDQSVHCVVTSPPYYGLRVYRADGKVIGLEQTPDEYLDAMMEVFDEVKRTLRDDGICWVNIGDSRIDSPSMMSIPWRFALRMQERGWILRSDVIWAKKSAMPESLAGTRWERCRVKVGKSARAKGTYDDLAYPGEPQGAHSSGGIDGSAQWADCPGCSKCEANGGYVLRNGSWRCTSAHEYIFQFVKGMGYWSDGEAVKTKLLESSIQRNQSGWNGNQERAYPNGEQNHLSKYIGSEAAKLSTHANRRSVWNDIKPEPFGGQHYATFPSGLPRICIQASTSEAGACSQCGKQWARVVEHKNMEIKRSGNAEASGIRIMSSGTMVEPSETRTLSWRPTCTCNADKAPPVVLDCFCGTGTTLLAAQRLGRRGVGVDLSADYLQMAVKRLEGQSLPMLAF